METNILLTEDCIEFKTKNSNHLVKWERLATGRCIKKCAHYLNVRLFYNFKFHTCNDNSHNIKLYILF